MLNKSRFMIDLLTPDRIREAFLLLERQFRQDWNWIFPKYKKMREVFPENLFVTIHRETNEVAAVISTIPSAESSYMVGSLVVKPDYRGSGLGLIMLRYAADAFPAKSINFTATPRLVAYYSPLGFELTGPVHDVHVMHIDREKIRKTLDESGVCEGITLAAYTPDMFDALKEYDSGAKGFDDGGRYLSVLVSSYDHVIVAKSEKTGRIVGYLLGFHGPSHVVLDGLYADTDGIALRLFREFVNLHPNTDEFEVQVVEPRSFLLQFGYLVSGMSTRFHRMARGPPQPVSLNKLYAVSNNCV